MKYSKPIVGEQIQRGDVLVRGERVYLSGVEISIICSRGKIIISHGSDTFKQNSTQVYKGWVEIACRKVSK